MCSGGRYKKLDKMSGLPLEYWLSSMIMVIAVEAGKSMVVDGFMDHLRKIGYAWFKVVIGKISEIESFDQGEKGVFGNRSSIRTF